MRLVVVTPWFGRELKGGAEQQAWQIASRLSKRGHEVEVLTTCCRSHQDDWSTNHWPAAVTEEREGFRVRRFLVDPRNRSAFDAVCARLTRTSPESLLPGVSPVSGEKALVFANELIRSEALLGYLEADATDFQAFILLPYLYGPVLNGIKLLAERACLQPCLHDEPYAYLPDVADAFYKAARIFFNSRGEAELAKQLYGPAVAAKSVVVGEGVEVNGAAGAPCERVDSRERYVLYLGRKIPGKNVDMLVRAFSRFRRVRPNSSLRLVLAGHDAIDLNGAADTIQDAGLVDEATKENLLRNCLALAQPSTNESFSRVMIEAWAYNKPVAVNAFCLATAAEVRTAEAGWLLGTEDDWAKWFLQLDRTNAEELGVLGANGKRRADEIGSWDAALGRYERALADLPSTTAFHIRQPERNHSISIHQFLPNLSYGDAISHFALWIRDELRSFGYDSNIYVQFIDPRLAEQCNLFSSEALESSDSVIYHHSIGSELMQSVSEFRGAKCLVYHNITPAEFLEPFSPEAARLLRAGRRQLHDFASRFELSYGVSTYNAQELAQYGLTPSSILPLPVDPQVWAFRPDEGTMRHLQDGRTNILFVGRIAPNKKQDELVRAFGRYLALDPTARLHLVGFIEYGSAYAEHVRTTINALGIGESVNLTGTVSLAHLAAYYRTADLFWCMSEHEGFCVPLVEAMWFDIPILSFHSSAIPETLGKAALTFRDKSSPEAVAGLAQLLVTDPVLRSRVIAAQRSQRRQYLPERTRPLLRELATALELSTVASNYRRNGS